MVSGDFVQVEFFRSSPGGLLGLQSLNDLPLLVIFEHFGRGPLTDLHNSWLVRGALTDIDLLKLEHPVPRARILGILLRDNKIRHAQLLREGPFLDI